MALFQKDHQHPERHAYTHADVCKVEHGEPHEQQVDVVHHFAVEHAVDQVANAAAQHQNERRLLQVFAPAAEKQRVGYQQQSCTGCSNEEQLLAAEQAERHALIEHEPQLHHTRDERHGPYRLQHIGCPQLDELVDAHQRRHRGQIEKYKCHRLLPNDPV